MKGAKSRAFAFVRWLAQQVNIDVHPPLAADHLLFARGQRLDIVNARHALRVRRSVGRRQFNWRGGGSEGLRRRDLPQAFGAATDKGRPFGTVWFEDPKWRGHEPLVKFLFTSETVSIEGHPNNEQAKTRGDRCGELWNMSLRNFSCCLGITANGETTLAPVGAVSGHRAETRTGSCDPRSRVVL